jgi:glycogen debranching enzyme
VVKDISPHNVERTLYVNEAGDPTAVALIKATAFSEAYKRLCQVLEENAAEYKREAGEIKKDFAEQIKEAQAAELAPEELETQVKTLRAEEKGALLAAGLFRSPDFENMAIVCEAMGITDEALDFYGLAAGADPGNSAAASALARVSKLADKVVIFKDKINGGYEEEENKER